MATTINAGRVRFVSRGTYNNSTQYYLFDLVDYNGSSYIAKENTLGNLPTNTQYWQLIAEKGNTGNTGQTGPTGATGNGILSITKTATVGLADTYTITYTNGNTTTFDVSNGNGIDRIEKTATVGNKDTYTIYFTNGSTTTYEVSNGGVTREELEEEVDRLSMIYNAFPTTTGEGEGASINGTAEVPFKEIGLKGNTSQDGTPTPDTPIPVNVVTGDNSITISNNDNTQSQTYPINLGSMELCKIGDYQDRIVKDNGKWYLEKQIGKVVLDGSENWVSSPYGTNTWALGNIISTTFDTNILQIMSNKFRGIPHKDRTTNENNTIYTTTNTSFEIRNTELTDIASVRNTTNGTPIYYVLATPTTTEITDTTLIEQLDNLEKAYSYDTQTNISQTNQDKHFIISYEAILSLKNVLND